MAALDKMMFQNLRLQRAMGLAHEIDRGIQKAAPELFDGASSRERKDIHYAILEALMSAGAELVTDHDRQEAGLPPRGPEGWTLEELHAFKRTMLDAMIAPPQMIEIADK